MRQLSHNSTSMNSLEQNSIIVGENCTSKIAKIAMN